MFGMFRENIVSISSWGREKGHWYILERVFRRLFITNFKKGSSFCKVSKPNSASNFLHEVPRIAPSYCYIILY